MRDCFPAQKAGQAVPANDRVQIVTQNEYFPAYRKAGLREIASRRAANDQPLFSFHH